MRGRGGQGERENQRREGEAGDQRQRFRERWVENKRKVQQLLAAP